MRATILFVLLWVAVALPGGPADAQGLWDGAADVGGGWKWLDWFDYFNDTYDPWIYHEQHGWLLCQGSTTADVWLFDVMMGWLWTADSVYPWLYKSNEAAWVWYQKTSTPRLFYNARTGLWYSPSSTRDNTGYTVLFGETFSAFPGSKWVYSGSPQLDRSLGFPSSPSICLDVADSITAFASGWSVSGGLQMCVRVYGAASCAHRVKLYSDSGEYPYAEADIWWDANHWFEYKIRLAGDGSAHFSADESLAASYADKRWFDLCFTVHPDGASEWSRDGVRMLYVSSPFPSSNLKLQIRAVRDCASQVYFDDVVVRRPQ